MTPTTETLPCGHQLSSSVGGGHAGATGWCGECAENSNMCVGCEHVVGKHDDAGCWMNYYDTQAHVVKCPCRLTRAEALAGAKG